MPVFLHDYIDTLSLIHVQLRREGAASLNDMKDMLANLPQYQEQREKFSLHLTMAQQCMDTFERDRLTDIATVEQVQFQLNNLSGYLSVPWHVFF